MAPHSLPCPPPVCPQCGRPMTLLELDVPLPPYLVSIAGCASCGITSNERAASPAVPVGAAPGERGRK